MFQHLIDKADKEAQAFVSDLRRRIESIEAQLPDDFDLPEYERGLKQIKFLQQCINIIVSQQNLSVQMTDAIARTEQWTIEKELELEQAKLELSRMKQNNTFLLKLINKLKGSKIIKPIEDEF